MQRGNFEVGRGTIIKFRDLSDVRCAKTVKAVEIAFRIWTLVGPWQHILDRVHIGATWQTRLNRPCVMVMRSFVKLL